MMAKKVRYYNYVRRAFFYSIGAFILTNVMLSMMTTLLPKLYGSLEIHILPLGLLLIVGILLSEYIFALACAVFYALQQFEWFKTIGLVVLFFVMLVWIAAFLPGLPQAPTFRYGDPISQKVLVNERLHYIIIYSIFRYAGDNFSSSSGIQFSNRGDDVYLCECDPFMFLCNVIKHETSLEAVMN